MKSLALTMILLNLSHVATAGEYTQARGQHTETHSYLAIENCRSAHNIVTDLAVKNCENIYKKCQYKTSIVLENRPVTDLEHLSLGWRRICKVTATAVEVNQVKPFEVGIGYGGSYCHSQSGHFNALISRLGFDPEISAYSRCDTENYNYDIGGEIVFGLRMNAHQGTSQAISPIKFKKMKNCIDYLHGDLASINKDKTSVSVGNENFSLSLYCEKSEKRGFQLSGTISRY